MAGGKSHSFNVMDAASKRPKMKALPDNVPRFGLVEAYDHFLHVSRTYPILRRIGRLRGSPVPAT